MTVPSLIPAPNSSSSARLAFELATGIKAMPQILTEFGMQAHEVQHLLRNDTQFANQVKEIQAYWNSSLSTKERVGFKTAIMAEDGLLELWGIFMNQEVHPNVRLDIHKYLAKLGALEPKPEQQQDGPRFTLTLNLGGGEQVVVDSPGMADEGAPLLDSAEVVDV